MSSFLDAARWTGRDPLPHQLSAWHWLDDTVPPEVLDEFLVMFRADPPPKPAMRATFCR